MLISHFDKSKQKFFNLFYLYKYPNDLFKDISAKNKLIFVLLISLSNYCSFSENTQGGEVEYLTTIRGEIKSVIVRILIFHDDCL